MLGDREAAESRSALAATLFRAGDGGRGGCGIGARRGHPAHVAIAVDDLPGASGLRAVHGSASDDDGEPLSISW